MAYLKDLVLGEVYKMNNKIVTECSGKNEERYTLNIQSNKYYLNECDLSYDWILASPQEKAQYIECKKRGVFVPLHEINFKPKWYAY